MAALLSLVQQAMTEMGLPTPTSVASNTNADVVQTLALMNAVGYEIQRQHQWQTITKEYRFTTSYATYTGTTVSGNANISAFTATGGSSAEALSLPGVSGANASTPDSTALDITGDLDLIAYIQPNTYTSGGVQPIISKWLTAGSQKSYLWVLDGSGNLTLYVSQTGVIALNFLGTIPVSVQYGNAVWVRVTLDVDNGSGGATATFYQAPAQSSVPTSWKQIETVIRTASTVAIYAGTATLQIGEGTLGAVTNGYYTGKINYALIKNGINGTTVASFNPNDATVGATSWVSMQTGETYTVNGTASLTNIVVPILGTPLTNYMVTGTGIQQDTYLQSQGISAATATLTQPSQYTGSVTLTVSQTKYPMPADFDRLVDDTDWDKSKHWQMLGPETAQQWQWLKSGYISTGPRIRFRPLGGYFQIWPPPGAADYLGFEYVSNYIVTSATSTTGPDKVAFTADTDTSIFPDRLMVTGTKLKFWEIKGFDTTALWRDYNMQLDMAKAMDAGSPSLSMAPKPTTALIGFGNIPDSGYGS